MDHPQFEAALSTLLEEHPKMTGFKKCVLIGDREAMGDNGLPSNGFIAMSLDPSDYMPSVRPEIDSLLADIRATGKVNDALARICYMVFCPQINPDESQLTMPLGQ